MGRLRHPALLAASFALAVSMAFGALAADSGRGNDWEKNEAAIRAAELCENWSLDEGQRKRNGGGGHERWERNNLSTGERLNALERGRRQADRLVRERGCDSDEVRFLLDFFHEFVEPLFD